MGQKGVSSRPDSLLILFGVISCPWVIVVLLLSYFNILCLCSFLSYPAYPLSPPTVPSHTSTTMANASSALPLAHYAHHSLSAMKNAMDAPMVFLSPLIENNANLVCKASKNVITKMTLSAFLFTTLLWILPAWATACRNALMKSATNARLFSRTDAPNAMMDSLWIKPIKPVKWWLHKTNLLKTNQFKILCHHHNPP